MANLQVLKNAVAEALNGKPSEQPVHTNASDKPREQSKANATGAMANQKFKQKGNPNKQYSVAAINKATAKLG